MQTDTTPASAVDVAAAGIRQLIAASHFPAKSILDIAREVVLREISEPSTAWELSAVRGDLAKPLIEARSGQPYTTEEAAERLEMTGQTVRNRIEKGDLIAYPARAGKGFRLPRWQITSDGKIKPWVAPLLAAYGHNGWGLVDFLTVPRDHLDGMNYLTLTERGEEGIRDLLESASRSNPD